MKGLNLLCRLLVSCVCSVLPGSTRGARASPSSAREIQRFAVGYSVELV